MVRVRIGLSDTPREIELELLEAGDFLGELEKAISGDGGLVWATDLEGHRYGISAAKVAYVHLEDDKARRVGFGRDS